MAESKLRILLAEDDKNLGTVLKAYLEAKGFETTLCVNGEEALHAFGRQSWEFCILDIMMPIKDGFTVAREIRQMSAVPIIFLTARSMQDDKMRGFNLGADDYITKPFSMDELLARINAILRRADIQRKPEPDQPVYHIGNYEFDVNAQILRIGTDEQKLTSKETMLLKLLCENENNVLDRRTALQRIWNDDNYFNARSMDVYITKLRKYFKEDSNVRLLNVHGVGFKLVTQQI
ncbi:MAG TPA: DNA-binding response regulator [Bacteroidales bacterium]|nr:MAG: two-component system response regulator [Bacteroidetes bacterium GWE2_42_24]OFY30692.1 MAG: two-component system response regulator [Bacteroidetes bacterium GWF2_43_11]PKP27551.1 MAG: DNA-binding response regulator [Bacteroidetes bacterium HGW-Bacteroidetes-22]HAQ65374.1 DNA-binding response regulator [Bacteroidales bacterium]HBZ65687.1 DNA-binding response regulator [Bacteroidales bacterium]